MANFTQEDIIEHFGLEEFEKARFSNYFLSQLAWGLNTRSIDAWAIFMEIRAVERGSLGKTEKERPFNGHWLKGFHYKHWFEAKFIGRNLINHWKMENEGSQKFQNQMLNSLKKRGVREGDAITDEAYGQMVHDFTVGGYLEKMKSGKATGERIIFYPHEETNYYLSLSLHSEPDEAVYYRIALKCSEEFPFLIDDQKALKAWRLMEEDSQNYQQNGPFLFKKQ